MCARSQCKSGRSKSEPVDVEGEDWLLHESLLYHVVEYRVDPEDGDGGEAHAEDAVELGGQEGQTGLVGGLSEGLVLDAESGHLGESSSAIRSWHFYFCCATLWPLPLNSICEIPCFSTR